MDNGNSNKRLNVILAVGFIIILLLVVNILALLLPHKTPEPYAVPGPAGKDAQVDYSQVDTVVQKRVQEAMSALPMPRDGTDGRDGADGLPGPKGDKGDKGDLVICRQIEIRPNPETKEAEYRYIGDDIWLPVPIGGVIENMCEASDGLNGSGSGAI